MVGQNVKILMDKSMGDSHHLLVANYFKTGVRRLIGKPRLVKARHSNGSFFPVTILLGEMVENVDGIKVSRLLGMFTPVEDAVASMATLTEVSSATFSEDEWSDDDEMESSDAPFSLEPIVTVIDKLATHIELRGGFLSYYHKEELTTREQAQRSKVSSDSAATSPKRKSFGALSLRSVCACRLVHWLVLTLVAKMMMWI